MKVNNDLSKKIFKGAFILTVSTIFIKLLSALYRIPYQNVVGDVGFYIYQQVYPFYSLVLVLSTYGFPVAISKLLAEEKENKQGYTRSDIFVTSWLSLSLISIIAFLCLYWGAQFLASIMNDPMLVKSIRLISFSFLLIPVISVLKGIFQSNGDMLPTAISQVIEQAVRVTFILLSAYLFLRSGLSLYEVAEGAFLGSVVGSVVGFVILGIFYIRNVNKTVITFDTLSLRKSFFPLSRKVIGQGIIFSISSLILVFIQFMDALILYPMLTSSGIEMTEAKVLKGIYDRGQPLLQVGTAATISLSLTIVPLISKFRQQKDLVKIKHYTELSFRLSLMLGMAAAVGLFWIIEPTNYILFTDRNGSAELGVLICSILFCSLLMTGIFILQSLEYSVTAISIVLIGLLVKFICMLFLIPNMYIMGAAISTTVSFIVMACILFVFFRKVFKQWIIKWKTFKVVMLATMSMSAVLLIEAVIFELINASFLPGRIAVALQVLFSVATGGIVYIFIVIRSRLFTIDELQLLPGGSKLSKLLPKNK